MNKTTKTILWIILAIIVIGGIWYGVSRKPGEEVIKIGFVNPITGPFATWGESIKNGVEIAIGETKHKFKVYYEDDACEPMKAVTAAHYFFDIENIKLIIGSGCDHCLKAIAPLAEEKGALLFSTGLLDDAVFNEYPHSVINLSTQISTEAKYIAKYLSSQGVKKVAMIHGTNFFGQEYGRRLPELLREKGIEVTSIEPSALDTMDFKTIILKMMKTNPEAIFIHQAEIQTGIFLKELREFGYDIPVYSYYLTEQESVKEAAGEALEGVIYTYPVNRAEGSEEKQKFEEKYNSKFGGKIPSPTSFFVYDGIMLLDKAMDKCGSTDIRCIERFFKEFGEYQGLSGDMKFERNGSLSRPFGIKKFENGQFIWVTKEIEL